jgi:hypothetical protein
MPASLREALTSARKFNENHDERGRFAESDSSGSAWSAPGKVSYEERDRYLTDMKDYAEAHPNEFGYRWGHNPDVVNPKAGARALETINELGLKFSIPLPGIDVGNLTPGMFQQEWGRGTVAVTTFVPGMNTRSSIELSPSAWSKDPATWESPAAPGWLVDSSPEGAITHEFGHAVQNELGSRLEDAQPFSGANKTYVDWMTNGDRLGLSGYSKISDAENFAETFTAAMTPSSPLHWSPQSVSMRSMLIDTGIWKG